MTDKELNSIGQWLNTKGYDLDLNDCFWMEDWIANETKFRDIAELMQEYHKEQLLIHSVSARLSDSLGECVEGNDYEIVADKDGRFWINHKEVGSGEPLTQWIDSVLNVR